MATKEEISSTDRLLQLIRSRDDMSGRPPADTEAPGLWRKISERLIPTGSRGFTGVEIFRDTINLVRMNRDKSGWHPVYAARTTLPEGIGVEHPDFPVFLKTQLRSADPAGKTDIWMCLPPSKAETWNVLVPRVKKGLTNAVYWSARKERTFESEYYFDYRIRGELRDKGIQKLEAEVSIASARDIDLYKKIFSETGYKLKGITLPAFALENLFVHRWGDPGDGAYGVLYIGEDSSYIGIHGRRTALFNRVIKTGRDSILDSLIMEYSAQGSIHGTPEIEPPQDRHKAAQVLRQQAEVSGGNLFDMIQPALERLARQLERTIDHSVNVLHNPAPERIYICGSISFLPGLSEFFGKQLGIDAVMLDVTEEEIGAGYGAIFPEGNERLCLISTVGLAMPFKDTLNFLYTAVDADRERQALRNANVVAAVCALLFIATAIWWWTARHELEQMRAETAVLEQELAQFSPKLTSDDLAGLAGELQEKNDELRQYSRKLYPVAALKEISRLTPENIELLEIHLENADPGSGRGGKNAAVLAVEGFVRSESSAYESRLTGYLLQLRRSPILTDPSVAKSEESTLDTGEHVYRFTLNMELPQI